ncbi:unnamed protein product [Darwinula stevensoni]|uniref:tRNA 4-demethylwyosine synthase (AdoMet-dependent) n=1 Tax=Darwinula stevensoni TaxID=69355 RepID=A0A7R9FRK1_9CRUS|nr:unnamed protein product [Darwinula stevensoni]CAG0901152.1 unnamed protein product [Darwinula stevensoni]
MHLQRFIEALELMALVERSSMASGVATDDVEDEDAARHFWLSLSFSGRIFLQLCSFWTIEEATRDNQLGMNLLKALWPRGQRLAHRAGTSSSLTMEEMLKRIRSYLVPHSDKAMLDPKQIPQTQAELPERRMQDSFCEVVLPLGSNKDLHPRYLTKAGGVRIGRLLEDMDVFAGWVALHHLLDMKAIETRPLPYSLVTALVDQIRFVKGRISPDRDLRLSGHVSYVGKSSLEVSLALHQFGEKPYPWNLITHALFVMVLRDVIRDRPVPANPLRLASDLELKLYNQGKNNAVRRMTDTEESLLRKPPTEQERFIIHDLFLQTLNSEKHTFQSRVRPPGYIWMEDAKLKKVVICHLEDRNQLGKIFGGFIMRQAFELAWANAYVVSRQAPTIEFIDDIWFRRPVEVGSLLYMASQVVFTEGCCMQVRVCAQVVDPESGEQQETNTFHFTFVVSKEVDQMLPKAYHESMLYLEGRRHFVSRSDRQEEEYCGFAFHGHLEKATRDNQLGMNLMKALQLRGQHLARRMSTNTSLTMEEMLKRIGSYLVPHSDKAMLDPTQIPLTQAELPERRMQDSFCEVVLPLGSNKDLHPRYLTKVGGVRIGRLLEDMDVFAAWVTLHHLLNPKVDESQPLPYTIVTALVDEISFIKGKVSPDRDLRLSGHVSWVGKSSVEVSLALHQWGQEGQPWNLITRALFVMVLRDAIRDRSVPANPLKLGSDSEILLYKQGEANALRRKNTREESLLRKPPNEQERIIIHDLFLSTLDPLRHTFQSRVKPPGHMWMEDAKLKNVIICHAEFRNRFGKIFGGFIMRQAFELAWANAYVVSRQAPTIEFIDDIWFRRPVEVGSLLYMASQVVFTEGCHLQVRVSAEVMNPVDGQKEETNVFHFTFVVPKEVDRMLPKAYHESMLYLEGRRQFVARCEMWAFLGLPAVSGFTGALFGLLVLFVIWMFLNSDKSVGKSASESFEKAEPPTGLAESPTGKVEAPTEKVEAPLGQEQGKSKVKKAKKSCCSDGGTCCSKKDENLVKVLPSIQRVLLLYGSQTGTAQRFAEELYEYLGSLGLDIQIHGMKGFDPEDRLVDEVRIIVSRCGSRACLAADGLLEGTAFLFLLSTHTDGGPPESAEWFHRWVVDAAEDFRVDHTLLQGMVYAAFGLGNSAYGPDFNKASKDLDMALVKLGAKYFVPLTLGDEDGTASANGGLDEDFAEWKKRVRAALFGSNEAGNQKKKKDSGHQCGCGSKDGKGGGDGHQASLGISLAGRCQELLSRLVSFNLSSIAVVVGKRYRVTWGEEVLSRCWSRWETVLLVFKAISFEYPWQSGSCSSECSSDEDEGKDEKGGGEKVMDMEDLGSYMSQLLSSKKGKRTMGKRTTPEGHGENGVKEMITPELREALTKQGYRLVGTHSGVKMCRWTKGLKFTFALSHDANFCWRHHSNPVGTEWRWKTDDPEDILSDALQHHYGLIRQFKGVPGVKADRMEEGLAAKHCALSLVGEPIMYPHIDAFLRLLHRRRISSFLVTNAQFPQPMRWVPGPRKTDSLCLSVKTESRELSPVTQLYVSVDAATKERLKSIDRPLFRDFWERFLECLEVLKDKGQRTVYRLTLVKGWNDEEIEAYARLVNLGSPDFVEIKVGLLNRSVTVRYRAGVTYCGTSKNATGGLTMEHIPWHEEVVRFVEALQRHLDEDYDFACEHEHSNCVLLAHRKSVRSVHRMLQFRANGEWQTWIDYDKFQDLVEEYYESGGSKSFTSLDYTARTPPWALYASAERGFDPRETRHRGKGKGKGQRPKDGGC